MGFCVDMKTRTDVINYLIKANNYKKYLEIGVRSLDENFSKIIIEYKVGVDPDPSSLATLAVTSDEFFSVNKEQFDLIFIDGLHESSQAYRDIENSLLVLSEGGTIVIHDCLPETEMMQTLPRQVPAWTGDVWKAFVRIREDRTKLKMQVIDIDYGVGVISKSDTAFFFEAGDKLTYKNYLLYRDEWLNTITPSRFTQEYKPCSIEINFPRVFYTIPWSSDKNIGRYYNQFMELLPDKDCFMCALDGDAVFLDKLFGLHVEQVLRAHKECGCFTAMTNRIGCLWQRQPGIEWGNNDIGFHRKKCQEVWETEGTGIKDVSFVDKGKVLGGVVILLKKAVWEKIGGFKEEGILGIDNDLHWRCMDHGEKVYLMKGIYVYHWYRGGYMDDRGHLL